MHVRCRNYSLSIIFSWENFVQKQEKNEKTIFLSWFLEKGLKMSDDFPFFSKWLALMHRYWSDFRDRHAKQWPNFQVNTNLTVYLIPYTLSSYQNIECIIYIQQHNRTTTENKIILWDILGLMTFFPLSFSFHFLLGLYLYLTIFLHVNRMFCIIFS